MSTGSGTFFHRAYSSVLDFQKELLDLGQIFLHNRKLTRDSETVDRAIQFLYNLKEKDLLLSFIFFDLIRKQVYQYGN
jgi:hypothetical protein